VAAINSGEINRMVRLMPSDHMFNDVAGDGLMIRVRPLGSHGPAVGCIGDGAMVLEGFYGTSDDNHALETIHRALDAV